ncbi:MAG: DUF3710 domain-containing protein [Micrococcales bacterium]|nr:DUF3710 domain-containing protein [Micrococcales bacterium]
MSPLFKRSKRQVEAATGQSGDAVADESDAGAASATATDGEAANGSGATEQSETTKADGPFDVTQVPELGRRIDLGAIRLGAKPGMAVRLEVDKASRQPVAVAVSQGGSTLRLQAFAAPKSAGLWEEVCQDLINQSQQAGGRAELASGPFGQEVLATMPVEGKKSKQRLRFIGVDGPRWFLRGQLSGPAATDTLAARQLLEVFASVVVVRGTEARPPKDLLRLHPPGQGPDQEHEANPATGEQVFKRGPEITEVR